MAPQRVPPGVTRSQGCVVEYATVFGGSIGFGNVLATANSAGSATAKSFSTNVAVSGTR